LTFTRITIQLNIDINDPAINLIKMKKLFLFFTFLVTITFFLLAQSYGGENLREVKVPTTLSPGLLYLLELVNLDKKDHFESERVADILNFVKAPKNRATLYYADKKTGSPSAYYEFDVHRSLEYTLKYAFNPEIPGFVMTPSSTRLSHWLEIEKTSQTIPKLWNLLDTLNEPLIVKGKEFIENTPDISSGAYYSYINNRVVILFKYHKRNVMISISKQDDISSVGKKGYVLGSDDDWDYFYSGEPGVTITGLGWVRSYMYDAYGITVYYELNSKTPLLRCGVFRWVRAGWSIFNYVKRHHIYKGLQRFAKSFKYIMEYPYLPSADNMSAAFSKIKSLTEEDLRYKIDIYRKILSKRYSKSHQLSPKWLSGNWRGNIIYCND
jgi:hypothetical protein